ncbi:hypothetical protein KAR91_39240 [Candidatus Pacearchaeota archaeon]|nr:hypothetical protein [Candidatus Pacearchaeota archaeon]
MSSHKGKQKRKHSGKVIRTFTVEVVVSDPALDVNPINPYTKLSEEERLKDFIEMFSLLWAESCRDASRKDNP